MAKSRYWTFIGYPESLKEDYISTLIDTGLEFCVSPLHDRDINEGTGEKKKPHYHFMVLFDGPTTYKNVLNNICAKIGATIPKPVSSVRGMYQYFIHRNNPEKAQYDESDITSYNGFDYSNYMSEVETNELMKMIINVCKQQKFKNYTCLVNFIIENEMYDFFRIVTNKTFFFKEYLSNINSIDD